MKRLNQAVENTNLPPAKYIAQKNQTREVKTNMLN